MMSWWQKVLVAVGVIAVLTFLSAHPALITQFGALVTNVFTSVKSSF